MERTSVYDPARGRFVATMAPLARFVRLCRFNPLTGCVEWIGATTAGKGKTARYGTFKFEGRTWKAHRWAARHILGLEIDNLEVDHECGNTLCVRHLGVVTGSVNRELYWIRVEVGLEPEPEGRQRIEGTVPYYAPPDWLPRAPAPTEPPF